MLVDALDAVAGYLDRRLVLTVLFPTLVFWSALVLLIGGHLGWHRMLTWWQGLAGAQQSLLLIAAGAGAIFFASLLSVFTGSLTRLYEGYWVSIHVQCAESRSWIGSLRAGPCVLA